MFEFFRRPGIESIVLNRQVLELQEGHKKSTIGTLAGLMISEGSWGLKSSAKKLGNEAIIESMETRSLMPLQRLLSPEEAKALVGDFTAIVAGVTIETLEAIYQTKEIDLERWVDRYNLAISDTPYNKYSLPPGYKQEKVEAYPFQAILREVEDDRTYAAFFSNNLAKMPDGLKKTIMNHYYYKHLDFYDFVSRYKPLAYDLISEPTRATKVNPSGTHKLIDAAMEIAGRRWAAILAEDEHAVEKCNCVRCAFQANETRILIAKAYTEENNT